MTTKNSPTILVIGATGKTGQLVVEKLVKRQSKVRVLTRSAITAEIKFGKSVEIFDGFDYDNPETAEKALAGVEKLYLVSSSDSNWVEQTENLIDLAKSAGVKHIVRLSVFGATDTSKGFGLTYIAKNHIEIENYIKENGFTYTFLRPMWFAQNIARQHGEQIKQESFVRSPFGPDAKVNFIDAGDIAEVAAIALTSPGHENKAYELTGPSSLSMLEAAAVLSAQVGKKIGFVDMSKEESIAWFESWGMPKIAAEEFAFMFNLGRIGATADITDDVKAVTGHAATSFEQYVKNNIRDFKPEFQETLEASFTSV